MIKVSRPSGGLPIGFAKAALKELRANRSALKRKKKLSFKVYSLGYSKDALSQIFGRKCAFCESLLLGTQPGDVEHYRPKGSVVVFDPTTGKKKTLQGYFWLAARWSNLLISCADCNRPRMQLDYDKRGRVIGKSNYFPLLDESSRANGPGGVSSEAPLLLHPCLDDPALHLTFKRNGHVEPALINGAPSRKGQETIRHCGLARLELIQMRARHERIVMSAIRHTIEALEAGEDPGADLRDLVDFMNPKEAYVAVTRSLVRTHMGAYLASLGLAV